MLTEKEINKIINAVGERLRTGVLREGQLVPWTVLFAEMIYDRACDDCADALDRQGYDKDGGPVSQWNYRVVEKDRQICLGLKNVRPTMSRAR